MSSTAMKRTLSFGPAAWSAAAVARIQTESKRSGVIAGEIVGAQACCALATGGQLPKCYREAVPFGRSKPAPLRLLGLGVLFFLFLFLAATAALIAEPARRRRFRHLQ